MSNNEIPHAADQLLKEAAACDNNTITTIMQDELVAANFAGSVVCRNVDEQAEPIALRRIRDEFGHVLVLPKPKNNFADTWISQAVTAATQRWEHAKTENEDARPTIVKGLRLGSAQLAWMFLDRSVSVEEVSGSWELNNVKRHTSFSHGTDLVTETKTLIGWAMDADTEAILPEPQVDDETLRLEMLLQRKNSVMPQVLFSA